MIQYLGHYLMYLTASRNKNDEKIWFYWKDKYYPIEDEL
jgi:hypothetical protein